MLQMLLACSGREEDEMGFLDKAKAAAGQAAAKAKQSAEDLQLKVDLGQAYSELGEATFELIENGELASEKLEKQAARVRELRAKASNGDDPESAATEPADESALAEPHELPEEPAPS
jgi:hypothetical protein